MRTHYCGLVDETLLDKEIVLCGWVDTRRDHGGVIFIDLRDHEGLVQVVVDPDNAAAFKTASEVGYEYCLRISGKVRRRVSVNDRVKSGRVEVLADRIDVLNRRARSAVRAARNDQRRSQAQVPLPRPAPAGHAARDAHAHEARFHPAPLLGRTRPSRTSKRRS